MSEDSDNGVGRVSFTVKELLAKLDAKLERIESKLDAKADAIDLERLASRVRALEDLTPVLEVVPTLKQQVDTIAQLHAAAQAIKSDSKDRFSRNEKLAGLMFVVASLVMNALPVLVGR